MVTTHFYLDTRCVLADGSHTLKLAIYQNGKVAYIPMDVTLYPTQWDRENGRVVRHANSNELNKRINAVRDRFLAFYEILSDERDAEAMSAGELRDAFLNKGDKRKRRFAAFFRECAMGKSTGTKRLYMVTYRRLMQYCPNLERLSFEDVDRRWLEGFDSWLMPMCPSRNARNIHLRNIRAVFNAAIDEEITVAYPFRKLKLRAQATRKRSMSVESLRELFGMEVEECNVFYRDMFKLIFMLIGINAVDLYGLKRIVDGRVEYYRAKTHKFYSVKVEPEAMELIEKYKGMRNLLCLSDRWSDHRNFVKQCNKALKHIGDVERVGRGGRKVFHPVSAEISTYWARHSWATIAASLDIPKETIAHALGHGCNTVTDIYIDFDERKVDEANRRVLDWVLYGKK